jgi:hypothetical protein
MPDENNTPLTGEAVRDEVAKAMSDPSHPQHGNYQRGAPEWDKWADGLYSRVPGAREPSPLFNDLFMSSSVPPPAPELDSPEGAQALAELTATMEQVWGAETQERMDGAVAFVNEVFVSPEEKKLFHEVASRLGDDATALRLLDMIATRFKSKR